MSTMEPQKLLVRCFAERKGDQWQAFTLELGLAAQGDSCEEVKQKLESMIRSYVYDAVAGEDKAFADQLLRRRAPGWVYAKYAWLNIRIRLHVAANDMAQMFREAMPLAPA